jgi:hypothetical protein
MPAAQAAAGELLWRHSERRHARATAAGSGGFRAGDAHGVAEAQGLAVRQMRVILDNLWRALLARNTALPLEVRERSGACLSALFKTLSRF